MLWQFYFFDYHLNIGDKLWIEFRSESFYERNVSTVAFGFKIIFLYPHPPRKPVNHSNLWLNLIFSIFYDTRAQEEISLKCFYPTTLLLVLALWLRKFEHTYTPSLKQENGSIARGSWKEKFFVVVFTWKRVKSKRARLYCDVSNRKNVAVRVIVYKK